MQNALKPDQMSTEERIAEISELLAAGFTRLHARQSRQLSEDTGESCLHSAQDRRRHEPPKRRRTRHS